MPKTPPLTPKKAPLKIWSDWSAGIGFAKDGEAPGMYKATALLGLRGELRVAPFLNTVTSSVVEPLSSYNFVNTTLTFSHFAVDLRPAASSTVATQGIVYTGKGADATLTYSATLAASTNGCLVVTVATNNGADPTGVTWGGVALTKVAAGVGNPRVTIWYKVAPAAATADIVVTPSAAIDTISSAQLYTGVHQATPVGTQSTGSGTASQGFNTEVLTTAQLNGMMVDACVINTTSDNVEPDSLQTSILEDSQVSIRGRATYKAISTAGIFHFMYFVEGNANTDAVHPFLYAERGDRLGGRAVLHKVDLSKADFATFEASSLSIITARFAGQPAKYQGFWWWPAGNDYTPRKLSVIGAGDASTDTLDASANPFEPGADHLVGFGNQMAGVVAGGVAGVPGLLGVGVNPGGVRILVINAAPATAANWGAEFPAGDATDRAGGLLNLHGATYVMMPDGLYSFNKVGRSGITLSDLGEWRNFHQNILWGAWKGGLMIPHPSGLIFYVPGDEPEYVGLGGGLGARALPPAGVTSIYGGPYHSVAPIGDYVYVVYQPDPSSTSALLMCGYYGEGGLLNWQSLAPLTLQDIRTEMGCYVAKSSRPLADTYVTPTVWSQSGANLVYVVLDGSGGPFRGRGDTYKVAQSGSAVMSEVFFEQPVDLDEVVAYAQDMGASDEWLFSVIVNGTGREENVGRPFIGDGRDSRPMGGYKRVHRLTLIVTFTTTDTSARVPPSLSQIELFGHVA